MSEQSVENFMRERVRQALEHPSKAVSSLAFSPDSTLLAIGTSDNRILLFGVANGVLVDGWNAIHSLVEHNRRKYKKVLDQRAVDPSTFLAIDIFLRNSTKVFSLAFRPGKVLQQGVCAALGEGSVGFWDLHGKQIKMWREDDKPVTNVVFSCD